MTTNNVKNLKKSDWQEIAKSFNIEFKNANEIRYLVEKIAEKIGVDDKIVNLDDLKKAVTQKLDSAKINSSVKEVPSVETPKEVIIENNSENLEEAELIHYRKEANRLGVNYGVSQLANDIKQILDFHCMKNPPVTYVPFGTIANVNLDEPEINKLEELRKECLEYGVAYSTAHNERDLEQLLNAIRGVVAKNPITDMPKSENFELKADNIDQMVQSAPSVTMVNDAITQPQGNIMQVITAQQPMMSTIGSVQMIGYRDVFVSAIRSHWRLLNEREIRDLIDKENYPFTYTFKQNPYQQNKIEMFFTHGANTIRVPSEDSNDWIDING
jgi:predicted component of type VI protein secretion system